jgi:N-acetylmuramoyl-L-alanine amidase
MKKRVLLVVVLALLSMFTVQALYAQRALSIPNLVVNTGVLNVRSGPGPQFSIIGKVRGGAELPVLGSNADTSWYYVASPFGAGWVDVSFTLPRGDFRFVPVIAFEEAIVAGQTPQTIQVPGTSTTVTAPVPQLGSAQVIVNTGNLNVRTGPGAQFAIITRVPGGTSLTPVGVTPDNVWYLVEGSFGQGWIAAEFTVFRGVFDSIPVLAY